MAQCVRPYSRAPLKGGSTDVLKEVMLVQRGSTIGVEIPQPGGDSMCLSFRVGASDTCMERSLALNWLVIATPSLGMLRSVAMG